MAEEHVAEVTTLTEIACGRIQRIMLDLDEQLREGFDVRVSGIAVDVRAFGNMRVDISIDL